MDISLARCFTVWTTVTVACLAGGWWAAGTARDWSSFNTALPAVAALALIICAAWAWWVTTVVITGAVLRHSPGRHGWAQRLVLAACGAVLVGGVHVGAAGATPGHIVVADDQSAPGVGLGALDGLALPGRPSGPLVGHLEQVAPAPQKAPLVVTVRSGDSLWRIAERLLAPHASDREITELMHHLHTLNRAAIGAEPDLIFPGHQLRTPLGERPAR